MSGYASYIQLDELLSLQKPRTKILPAELVFIVTHQVYELWFRLIIADIEVAIESIRTEEIPKALKALRRIGEIERLMLDQLILLEHLDPNDFSKIRRVLKGASGAESEQFSLIETLSTCSFDNDCSPRQTGDLWSAFCEMAGRVGLAMPVGATESSYEMRVEALRRIYVGDGLPGELGHYELMKQLCEALLDHDQGFALWRYRHCLTAFRQVGNAGGTGGTSGVSYLESRLRRRFYPEIWDVRAQLQIQ